jgi:hypothetical protein
MMNMFYVTVIMLTVFLATQKICDKLDEVREPLMCTKNEGK